ncbi:synergin gamma isoform X2 [Cherax quadricarinatus]|uniref:synergin gamma isoform X2 n=1 Tax=Cherax quadricarinatus TaxID=27406 RepID=UPI00387E9DF9
MSGGSHNTMSSMGQGGAWVPGMSMPPLGFGVVPQQPGGILTPPQVGGQQVVPQAATHITNWHQQQFMAAKSMAISSAIGVQPLSQQQQQHFNQQAQFQQQLQYQQQQQWAEAQKMVEEQKKLYEQMMKQRHFDEQKMRLKAFNTSKNVGVSADSMIENILGTKEVTKMRSPQPPKKLPAVGTAPSQGSITVKQGSPVDWSKLNNINTLFSAIQGGSGLPPSAGASGQISQLSLHGSDTTSGASFSTTSIDLTVQMTFGRSDSSFSGHLRLPSVPSENSTDVSGCVGNIGNFSPLVESGKCSAITKKSDSKGVCLPGWLSESNSIPAVYQQAGALVEGKDGWVDTSRAYMLLMKTGLPPPLLGVLWEMVNQTQPGQLLGQEFTVLLALVALVQNGKSITSSEVVSTLKEPILPIIDHPALLPLVQDYIKQKQQQHSHAENNKENATSGVSPLLETQQVPSLSKDDDDDFDDFVSGPSQDAAAVVTLPQCTASVTPMPNTTGQNNTQAKLATPIVVPSVPGGASQLGQRLSIPSVEKIKRMNLPKVGFSPELSPSTSFDHTCDDEFDDFQSAALTSVASSTTNVVPSFTHVAHTGQSIFSITHGHGSQHSAPAPSIESSTVTPTLLQPEKTGQSEDKYAVFRELEAPAEEGLHILPSMSHGAGTAEPLDESFGDFCSSEPVSLTVSSFPPASTLTNTGTNNTSPDSFEVYSTPPEMITENNVENYFEADFGGAFAASTQPPSNYADIHEAMKRVEIEQKRKEINDWSDPFGEFEEPPNVSSTSTTSSIRVPQLSLDLGDEDEDFGDFMGPDSGIVDSVGISGTHPFLNLSENLGETHSVASLELPGLEMTVGLQPSETHGSGSNQSPDLFIQPRNEIGGVEDQLRNLSLETSTAFGETSGNGSGALTSGVSVGVTQLPGSGSVLDAFGGGLVDKYSIIREEASKNTHDEAHTGSWQRCLQCSVQLLQQAYDILSSLSQAELKAQVLATSQMQEYLANLQEVWHVCKRISSSSQQVTTSAKVDELLTQGKTLWDDISSSLDNSIVKVETQEGDNQMGESEVCGVCLTGGGSKLTYGGHSYHPPCANLWLNCVDLLLPSLTPVTLL